MSASSSLLTVAGILWFSELVWEDMHSKEVSGPVYPDIPVEKNHITFTKLIKITQS